MHRLTVLVINLDTRNCIPSLSYPKMTLMRKPDQTLGYESTIFIETGTLDLDE